MIPKLRVKKDSDLKSMISTALIGLPVLFPLFTGVYMARSYENDAFVAPGIIISFIFLVICVVFERAIRKEGIKQGWSDAYDKNGKPMLVGEPYPGWKFPSVLHSPDSVWVTSNQISDHTKDFGQPGYGQASQQAKGRTEFFDKRLEAASVVTDKKQG